MSHIQNGIFLRNIPVNVYL